MGGGSFTLLPRLAREVFERNAADAARLFALLVLGMGLSTLVNAGLLPIGGLAAGFVASLVGVRSALSLFGATALACVITALVRAKGLRALV